MGLLLSGQGERTTPLVKFARKASKYLGFPLILVGILWLLALPSTQFSRKTYLSENAMMPGQATASFGTKEHIAAIAHIDTALHTYSHLPVSEQRANAVAQVFNELELDTEIQRFTYNEVPHIGKKHGVNVHGILRAPRGDAVESLVVVASWSTSDNKTNINAIRMMAGLAKYAQEQIYWAKDVVFVVTDSGEPGIETWLRAYHGMPGVEPLYKRSGAIQGAIGLELPSVQRYESLGLHFEGKSGQLPNLDLINIVQRVSRIEKLPALLHGIQPPPQSASAWAKYRYSAKLLLGQLRAQAIGYTKGMHAMFMRYRIDALTITGIPSDKEGEEITGLPDQASVRKVGRTIESTLRSLNNLLEHFHQSFFFYVMPANYRYISIGDYIPAIGLMVGGLMIQAMHLWWIQGTDEMRSDDPETRISRINGYYGYLRKSIGNSLVIVTRTHALGVVLLCVPYVVPQVMLTSTTSTGYVFTMSLASITMVLHLSDAFTKGVDWRQVKSIVSLYTAACIGSLSVMNFSLALVMFFVAGLPLFLTRSFKDGSSWVLRGVNVAVLLLLSPVSVLTVLRPAMGIDPLDFTSSPFRIFLGDFYHYSTPVYVLVCLLYWPVNLLSLVIAMLPGKK